MLQRIEDTANVSVARGCAFGLLAIFTFMIGLVGDPHLALRSGGFLSLLMCMILVLCAWHAPHKHYKSTETWLMLPRDVRPHPEIAQRIISRVLRDAFYRFAIHAAWLAVGFLALSFFFNPAAEIGGVG